MRIIIMVAHATIACATWLFEQTEELMATFLKNINMVARSATQFSEEQLKKVSDLKGYHTKYLLNVCANPGVSQDALAKAIFVNKSNVARQIAALEEAGYVERRQGEDKRVSLVYPTDKAKQILPVIRGINAKWREVITEGFSDSEKELLLSLTERLYNNAVKYMEEQVD